MTKSRRSRASHRSGHDDDDAHPALEILQTFESGHPTLDRRQIERAVSDILVAVGEDREREGLLRTPERVARAYEELLSGYRTDPDRLVNGALFEVDYDDMVIVPDIEFASLCEHHLLPFLGHVQVAYIPDGKIIGLSRIPRVVEMFARRLQIQERLTQQIADFLEAVIQPKGVGVVVEGVHMCSMMRGVRSHHASLVTQAMRGVFRDDGDARREFLAQLEPRQPPIR
jgi:GTP cyclohydrolase I